MAATTICNGLTDLLLIANAYIVKNQVINYLTNKLGTNNCLEWEMSNIQLIRISIDKKKQVLPIPCLGLGLSAAGFWEGRLTGVSVTSYLTLKGSSGVSSPRKKKKKKQR